MDYVTVACLRLRRRVDSSSEVLLLAVSYDKMLVKESKERAEGIFNIPSKFRIAYMRPLVAVESSWCNWSETKLVRQSILLLKDSVSTEVVHILSSQGATQTEPWSSHARPVTDASSATHLGSWLRWTRSSLPAPHAVTGFPFWLQADPFQVHLLETMMRMRITLTALSLGTRPRATTITAGSLCWGYLALGSSTARWLTLSAV